MEENEFSDDQKLITESQNWGAKEWIDYLSKEGTMTLDDFRNLNKKIIDETFSD